MRGAFYIDGKDAYDTWKISVREGGYNQFISFPPMKDIESNDWAEYDGVEADLTSPLGDGRTFSMDFHCLGTYADMKSFLSYLFTPYGVNHVIYHILKGSEIGGKQVMARPLSLGSVDLGNMRPPMLFSIDFADDSGFIYDDNILIPSPSSTTSDFSIDGISFAAFGISKLEGTIDGIKDGSGIKDGLSINLIDEPGVMYDVNAFQKMKSKTIILICHMKAGSLSALWDNYLSLENLLFKPGERTIWIASLGESYVCHYSKCNIRNFFPANSWIDFDLTFKVLGLL